MATITSSTDDAPVDRALAFVLVAVGYMLAALASLPLAIPPYAAPIYPAAGVALVGVLIGGRQVLPAVALGSFCVNFWLALPPGPLTLASAVAVMPLHLGVGLGAMLQAWAAATLVRRFTAQPLTLTEPRDALGFLVACGMACLVSTSIAAVSLWLTHTIRPADLPLNAAIWWVGDLFGMLIGAPTVLTLFGRPRAAWAPRRRSVGLTLVLLTVLLAVGIRQVMAWNAERLQTAFDHDAVAASAALSAQLREPLSALSALNSVFIASDDVTAVEMNLATRAWLASGGLQAMAWSERLPRSETATFEARARADGHPGVSVFQRRDGPSAALPSDDDIVAIRFIEPLAGNAAALGVNVLSIPATRAAIELARHSGEPVATSGFRLTQQPAHENQIGVVVYQPVYTDHAARPGAPAGTLRGLVSVTIRMDDQLRALATRIPPHLSLCLRDTTPGAATAHLAGAAGCEQAKRALQQGFQLRYAGRQWEMLVSANPDDLPRLHGADVWLFSLVALLSTAVLGGFLLSVTGRAHRIETAVRERTAALQAEVHERQRAESALRESEQRFRNILNHVPIGVVYSDLRGNVKQTNPRFCELIGYTDDEVLRLAPADYTHPVDIQQDAELMDQLVRGQIPMYRRHKRYFTKSGTVVWVQATVSLLRFADGKPRSIVGVVEDITEHLKLEEAERAREAAELSNQAKSEFLSRMSHELRTPLNAMLGFAQLLELDPRHPLAPEQRPWVSQIQQAGWHLLEMINDVLDLSRIESGNLRLHTETLDLPALLAATVAMVEGEAQRRGLTITQEFTPGTATALGDATRVKQILTNLLSNAVKYNHDGGRVHIQSRLIGSDTVETVVTDTGLGMTPQQLGQLFQPFNRLGRERSAQQGTGIGLVISQRLAELMGGSLRARSVAGEGSAFVLTLPCSSDPDTVRSELDPLLPEPADYHRRLVHYVEDNETNVEVMRGILAQRPQVEMQVSVTGLDGLAAIRARRPDLILLDMHLPDISGMELLHHMKADAHTRDIPVVIVSADALAQQIDAAFEAGCTHYLTKPVSVSELLAVVDDLLERIETRFG